ncbi:hypothetical protein [Paenibacillus castaneae]|nr:hypothetical protein [Paenibacillus castaneae]
MISVVLIFLSACSTAEKYEHIEAFIIETLDPNEEGIHGKTGFKKVNAITITVEGKDYIKSDVKTIEDYYDLVGNFIKSEIKHSTYSKSYITMQEDGGTREKELQEPLTILIPDDNVESVRSFTLTEEEKRQVKEHVKRLVDKL